ncbi:hypothetical protein GCM10011609_87540 [Lentzea pudingi]|uniref:Resolvase/invertase-type recombinase catalytic domain-containing protein n=1 Tax=Lentzea pudingi TaxID=1789439 RepID=A0ABQ2IWR7_9PSEU|nr:hypothetical protein GCM10011609_87540 [Lentzea pudingi]
MFHFLAALAEYDREMIVEGTMDGLAAARARGRVGGRALVAAAPARHRAADVRLGQAYRREDRRDLQRRPHRSLPAAARLRRRRRLCPGRLPQHPRPQGRPNTNRRYGETGASEKVQLDADRKWFPVAAARWRRLKAIVYVVDGVVARICAVEADLSKWGTEDRGYANVPVTKPLTELQIAKKLPTLTIARRNEAARARQNPRVRLAIEL